MNFFKSVYIIIFLFLGIESNSLFADANVNNKTLKKDKVVFISIPKCGSFLSLKLFGLLDIFGAEVYKKIIKSDFEKAKKLKIPIEMFPSLPKEVENRRKLIPSVGNLFPEEVDAIKNRKGLINLWHLPYAKNCEDFINRHSYTNFLIIRDPRDQVVSMAHFVLKDYEEDKVVFNNVLLDLIDGKKRRYIHWGIVCVVYPHEWNLGVVDFYNLLYLPWMNSANFYTIKFENLIGVKGGGTKEAQVDEIKNIGNHLGINLTSEKIDKIINDLFGGTQTFREGKIGSWEEYFTPEVKEVFKAVPGANELLIKLGYEKDDKW